MTCCRVSGEVIVRSYPHKRKYGSGVRTNVSDLTRLFLPPTVGAGTQLFASAVMTVWDPVTHANTVTNGVVVYTNLPVINAAGLVPGLVLMVNAPGGPIVLGNIVQAT